MHAVTNNFFFKLALIFVAVCCIGLLVVLHFNNNALRQERNDLLAEIEAGKERVEAVRAVLDTPFDHEYIIKIAREKLNLRLPEEIVFYNDMND
ncbi:MAG: hypothetical protein IJZ08_09875 [Clostridia bacterium]|nr:hypothetical protein [Clostridia bacterium]